MNAYNFIYGIVLLCMCLLPWTIQNKTLSFEELVIQAQKYKDRHDYKNALIYYNAAIEMQPNNTFVLADLGNLNVLCNNYKTAFQWYIKLLKEYPTNVDLLCCIGFILRRQNYTDKAIKVYEYAKRLSPNNPKINRALSHAYLTMGNFHEGLPLYEYRWINPPAYNKFFKDHFDRNLTLNNIKVLIKTEYGFGDTFQFIRYVQLLKALGATTIIETQKVLVPILSQSCPYIDQVISNNEQVPATDFQVQLMSLPFIFSTTLDTIPVTIPYMHANHERTMYWQSKLVQNAHLNIGICWQAETHETTEYEIVKKDAQDKSISLSQLAVLSHIPGIHLYSLQKVHGLDQLTTLPPDCVVHTFDSFDELNGSFTDTAAIMKCLDLVITIDTSIAHLAGALGVPVWVILPYFADWRWMLNRTDSPWYPTMRLFRQPKPGDWESVIKQIMLALQN